jgi:hypothetical protein
MSKYSAIRTVCAAGHKHDSKIEARRCDELTAMEAAGEITHLVQQPEFRVTINDKLICRYVADFQYRMADSGLSIVCDVKGMKTPVFNLKRKLVEAQYPGVVISLYPPEKPKTRKRKAA